MNIKNGIMQVCWFYTNFICRVERHLDFPSAACYKKYPMFTCSFIFKLDVFLFLGDSIVLFVCIGILWPYVRKCRVTLEDV